MCSEDYIFQKIFPGTTVQDFGTLLPDLRSNLSHFYTRSPGDLADTEKPRQSRFKKTINS